METQATKDFQRKIEELEVAQVCLKKEIWKLLLSETLTSENNDGLTTGKRRYGCYSAPPSIQQPSLPSPLMLESGGEAQLNSGFYLNVLQSMGQAVHILDKDYRIIYWNRTAENLYGYSAEEALGENVFDLLIDTEHVDQGVNIVDRAKIGQCWTGLFPINSNKGKNFTIGVTTTPLYDEDGTTIGVACLAIDSKSFEDMRFTLPYDWNSESNANFSRVRNSVATNLGLDPDQPLQDTITSKITELASKVGNKVKSKMRHGKNNVEYEVNNSDYGSFKATLFGNNDESRSNITILKENAATIFETFSKIRELASKLIKDVGEESEGNASLNKISSKAEAWISNKSIKWPWKENQQKVLEVSDLLGSATKSESRVNECGHLVVTEELGTAVLSSVFTASSKINVSSTSTDTSCSSIIKLDMGTDCLDYEILPEDLMYKQKIGQGSCGKVYHALYCGSDVASKVFPEVDYTYDAILSFRREVSIMKGLRHPNILLLMGAVLSPQHLSIITEFLPRFILTI